MGFGPWLYPGHSSAIREGVRLMADGIRPTRALTNDIVSAVNQLGGSRAGAAELLSTSLERIATGKLGPAGRALELGTDLARSGAIGGRALIDPAHAGALRAGARELADGSVSYGLEADIRAALSYL
jgi:hypothetical protein